MPAVDGAAAWFGLTGREPASDAPRARRASRSLILRGLVAGVVVAAILRFLFPVIEPFPTTFGGSFLTVLLVAMLIRTRQHAPRPSRRA